MLINKNINEFVRLKFLQVYEDFNKDIPDELIEIFNKIKTIIGYKNNSFNILLKKEDIQFIDSDIEIELTYTQLKNNLSYCDKDIVYYSNINLYDLLHNKPIKIPITIIDCELNNDKMYSTISHEIRHIYDFFNVESESDFKSFINSLNYTLLKEKNNDIYFNNFLELIYVSLEHELIVRNTMIYENFINCKCSLDVLRTEFEKTYMYKSLIMLQEFEYDILIDIKYINLVNLFIDKFGGDRCADELLTPNRKVSKNENAGLVDNDVQHVIIDINNFFSGWKDYFTIKSKEYLIESDKVLNKIYNVIKEKKEYKKIKSVKNILLNIYNQYIKTKS